MGRLTLAVALIFVFTELIQSEHYIKVDVSSARFSTGIFKVTYPMVRFVVPLSQDSQSFFWNKF